jgi:hypothetical protein
VFAKIRAILGLSVGKRPPLSVVVARLAIECYAKLPPSVRHRAGTMRSSELRGYLQARLYDTLPRRIEAIRQHWRLRDKDRLVLIEQTLDQLSTLCIRVSNRRMAA